MTGESGYRSSEVPAGALFVHDGSSLLVFPSVTAAERSLDPSDVEGGCYVAAYGPTGEPYRITCKAASVRFEQAGEPRQPEQLKALLLRYCEDCEDPDDASTALDALVAHAWSIERDFRLRCGEETEQRRGSLPVWGCLLAALVGGAVVYLVLRWSGLWPPR